MKTPTPNENTDTNRNGLIGDSRNSKSAKCHLNLGHIPAEELLTRFVRLVKTERKITHLVLEYIAEIDARRLYADLSYPSLYEFLVREFGYSPSSAMRRIESARLLREIPELAEQLESGALNLSQLSRVQQAIRAVQKTEDRKMETHEKRILLSQIENTSQQQTEVILCQALSIPIIPENKQTTHGDSPVTLTITFTKEQFSNIKHAHNLISHAVPDKNWADAFTYLAKKEIHRRIGNRNSNNSSPNQNDSTSSSAQSFNGAISTSVADAATRKPLSSTIRKAILQVQRYCQFKDPKTGKICGSESFLQIDHIQPVWAGGNNDIRNLQVLCARHNQLKYRNESRIRIK
ncbi:HNH endonuclease [Bdellovibrio sp. HCB290]|uniref:HNH endonuclease n=1 Tax=Bdellovibrio sp. HCB290 TaxID=3394356 RepID=UPI0039B57E6B